MRGGLAELPIEELEQLAEAASSELLRREPERLERFQAQANARAVAYLVSAIARACGATVTANATNRLALELLNIDERERVLSVATRASFANTRESGPTQR